MSQSKEQDLTRLESAEEILKALAARKKRAQLAAGRPAATVPTPVVADAQRERPLQRPPMALLCILDDSKEDEAKPQGEWIRLRADRTRIGRSEGDVRIPHDMQMSSQHAEIVREAVNGGWRWSLQDVGSTNGTYVRIGNTPLRNYNEVLIGQGRYRFEAAMIPPTAVAPPETNGMTQAPQPGLLRSLVPSLVEITAAGPIQRFPLTLPEYWIGRAPGPGGIARPDDPFIDAQHARFWRDKNGQWHVANNASVNGLWMRIKMMPMEKGCHFRLGEQRFLFRMCE